MQVLPTTTIFTVTLNFMTALIIINVWDHCFSLTHMRVCADMARVHVYILCMISGKCRKVNNTGVNLAVLLVWMEERGMGKRRRRAQGRMRTRTWTDYRLAWE